MLVTRRSTRFAALLAAGSLSAGVAAAPAAAAPVFTGGLVNVTLVDLVDVGNVNVQVPIGVAANLCDINANVLAAQMRDGGATCTSTAETRATNRP